MRTLVWLMIRIWRGLFPPYSDYWRHVEAGREHETRRLKIMEDIKSQPFLRSEAQDKLLRCYEGLRDKRWKQADELMRTPDRSEL